MRLPWVSNGSSDPLCVSPWVTLDAEDSTQVWTGAWTGDTLNEEGRSRHGGELGLLQNVRRTTVSERAEGRKSEDLGRPTWP